LLRIETGLLPVAERATSSLKPGHLVLAIGRLDENGPRTSFGAVSSVGGAWRSWKGGEIDALLQSDLTIYPGLGGGPLVDVSGRIHGINSGGLSRPLATTIPVQTVDRVITALLNKGYVARGYIGAALHAVRFSDAARQRMKLSHSGGVVVLEVDAEGPASSAGILLGDVLVGANGAPLDSPADLVNQLGSAMVGRKLKLDLVRGGNLTSVDLEVGERPRRTA
jgi:S1-C subfamily serine protease